MAVDTPFGRVDDEVLALSGLMILGGSFLVLKGLKGDDGPPVPTRPPQPGDVWGIPTAPALEQPGQIRINVTRTGNPSSPIAGPYLKIDRPQVSWHGPSYGREAFTSAYIVQKQASGVWASVYGSGVANAGMHNVAGNTPQLLVREDQLQPDGTRSPQLWLYPWPGTNVGPICGAPPMEGPGTLVLAVYGLQDDSCFLCTQDEGGCDPLCSPDWDGFSSPTCSQRSAVTYKLYRDKVYFHYV